MGKYTLYAQIRRRTERVEQCVSFGDLKTMTIQTPMRTVKGRTLRCWDMDGHRM